MEARAAASDNGAMSVLRDQPRGLRINGIVLVALLVFAGMGITSIYYRWRSPEIARDLLERRAAMPDDPEGRLEYWLHFTRPNVHQSVLRRRLSAVRPWLLAYVVEPTVPGAEPEIWGSDLARFHPEDIQRQGLAIVVRLPAPARLGTGAIGERFEPYVPRVPAGTTPPDAAERVRAIAEFALADIAKALAREEKLADARILVQVGDTPAEGAKQ